MSNEQPTAGDSGASSADPVDRIEAWLNASNEDSSTTNQDKPAGDEPAEPDDKPATPEKPESDAPGVETEPQFTTAQLAAFLDIDESLIDIDESGKPVFKNKIDGKEGAAKFADYVKSYQLQGHAENRVREAAAKEAAAQARLQEAEQAIQARYQQAEQNLQQVHALTAVADEQLMREFRAVPWDDLRLQNPGEYAARLAEFNARKGQINGVFQEINARKQQAAQQAQWQQHQAELQRQEAQQKALQGEIQRVTEVIPEWKDMAVAQKESADIREWALKRGYDQPYLSALSAGLIPGAALIVQDMRRAWKHDTLQQSKPAIENKVRTAPKLVKPGAQAQVDPNAPPPQLKSLKQQARTTGRTSTKAVMDYLMASGKA